MSRLLTDAILIAIPIVDGLVSIVLGAREVSEVRKETGDSSWLTSILGGDFNIHAQAGKH